MNEEAKIYYVLSVSLCYMFKGHKKVNNYDIYDRTMSQLQ